MLEFILTQLILQITWGLVQLSSNAQASLELALDLLMSEEAYAVPGLRPAVGRLANALVAVLGPELRLGSDAYVKSKSLIREMQVDPPTQPS
jgi:hypothetical protein